MIFNTLDEGFIRQETIDKFVSGIWTERFSTAGDFQLSVPASPFFIDLLSEGTFITIPESDEVAIIDTQSIESGILTVTGKMIITFFNQRVYRFSTKHWTPYETFGGLRFGAIIESIVRRMCVVGVDEADLTSYGLDGPREVIPNLSVSNTDTASDMNTTNVSSGQVYDVIENLATQGSVGISLQLAAATLAGYSLVLKIYNGLDRTSTQMANDIVRFSPNLKTLTNIKELRSSAAFKNVAYAYIPALPDTIPIGADPDTAVETTLDVRPGKAFLSGADILTGFDRRVLLVLDDTFNIDSIPKDTLANAQAAIASYLDIKARDALYNNTYTKVVDGEVVPQTEYQYGRNYNLGDIIELQGYSGTLQRARVTEYIRSQDSAGQKAYPTISVID